MGKQESGAGVEETTRGTINYRSGPFKGKTCYVEMADLIRVKVELGFRTSIVADFKVKNLSLSPLQTDKSYLSDVKSCFIILLGGHHVVLNDVEEPVRGVHPARLYIQCAKPPSEVHVLNVDGKTWMDVGEYLHHFGPETGHTPEQVREDYWARR